MFDIVGIYGRDARAAVWNGLLRVAHLFGIFAGVLALAGAFSRRAYSCEDAPCVLRELGWNGFWLSGF